jgi:hypothetical protein
MTPYAFAPPPPSPCPRLQALDEGIAKLSAQIDAATHRLLKMLVEFDHLGGWSNAGFQTCAHWLSWRTGMALGAARERVRVAKSLGELPLISGALARGELSYSKARALTRVARPDNEERLLAFAMHATAAQTERLVAGWARLDLEARMDQATAREAEAMRHDARALSLHRDPADGSWVLQGRLDPEVGLLLQKALELAAEALYRASRPNKDAKPSRAACQADALGLIAEAALREGMGADERERERTTSRSDRFQVILHVSAETPCETSVPSATAARLACDASRVVVYEDKDGTPLSVGRRSRIVPPHIRRALELRDDGCRFPGCGNRICDAHHIVPWKDGGATELGNLVLLCRHHHRRVHEDGFRAQRKGKQVHFFDPAGKRIFTAPPRPRLRGDVSVFLRSRGIDAYTNFPRWDGSRLHLQRALLDLWRPPPIASGTAS